MNWPFYIDAVPLLATLPPAARAEARPRSVNAGATVFARGARPSAMYVVFDGEIRLVRHSTSGAEIVLQRTRRGFVAEASLDQPAYHCDAVAVVDTSILAIPLRAFKRGLEDGPFRQTWIGHLGRELRRVRAQNERMNLRSAEERIIHYIESEGDRGRITLAGTRKEWAAELGLTHEALYRALARMQQRGRLRADGAEISMRF